MLRPSRRGIERLVRRALAAEGVARAEIGRKQYIDNNKLNGAPAAIFGVYQQAGANGLEVSKAVRKTLQEMKRTMPDGIDYVPIIIAGALVLLFSVEHMWAIWRGQTVEPAWN